MTTRYTTDRMDAVVRLMRDTRGLSVRVADACGIQRAAVYQWKRIPAKHVHLVGPLLGMTPEQVRPDIFRNRGARAVSEITDEQVKEMNRRYPSIRTPAHPFYKLGVLAEEHGMSDLLMALSQYCGCKIEEAMANDDKDLDMVDWVCMDNLVSAIAHQAWVLFEASKEEEAEIAAAAKPTHDTPEQTQ